MASVELAGRHWKISAVRALLYHKFCLDNQPVS
jgi:TrbL/VirB6 plasmid conjugal transfer protein.